MKAPRFLRCSDDGEVARITLARPPLNILTIEAMEELGGALEETVRSPRLKALVLAAEGKAFCAGVAVEDHLGDRVRPMLEAFHRVFRLLRAHDCLTLAAVQGAALGGGAELATFCDVVIASESATFGQPEIRVGVFPPIAVLRYPQRVGAARAARLVLSGHTVSATEAVAMGLADLAVAGERLEEAVEQEVARVRAHSAAVLRLTKRAIRGSAGMGFDEALVALEDLYHYELMATRDAEEGLRAFVEKRQPVWTDR